MDGNDWRAPQGQVQIPGQVNNGEVSSAPGMDVGDWRTQLQPDSRHRIVNKIMETLKRHLPFSGPEGLQELKKIALRFEEKIYSAATSQSDYLRKISLKMLTMETKSQNPIPLQSNAPSNSMNPPDQASQAILSQMQNQVQQIPMPMASNQTQVRQQPLPQNMPPPSSTGLTPGMSQGVPVQNPNLHNIQNMPNVPQNAAGLGAPQQRQMQGRPQQMVSQEQQQLSQNSQQYPYNPQLQQHILKQKFQQGNVPQSMMQSQIQQQQQPQQNLLQPNSQQPSQPGLMQPSLRQMPAPSTLQPNQQSSLQQQSNQSMLQQQSQSVRQQQGSMPQHPMMSLQQQQQQLMGPQSNVGNMQQSQLNAQQQHHQQRVITQQNVSGVQQQPQTIHQQNALQNVHQQQSTVQQNNLSNVHQQQVATQTNLSSFQPQQMGGIQHGNATMQPNQQPVHTLQHSKVSVQQQTQQNMGNMLPNQSQQPQSQPMQLPMSSQFQSQPGQMQPQLGLQQQGNMLQRDMQQRIQSSGGPLLQQQTTIDQQKQLLQTQRVVPDQSANQNQSTQTGSASGGDWQEEVYQKIKSMYELYYPELNEMYQRMAAKLQQHDALPQQPKNEQLEKLRIYKSMLERYMMFLRTNKNEVIPSHREKIPGVEKQIVSILNNNRPRKPPGQFGQPQMQAMPQSQQQQPQVSQNHNEGQMNSQMQQMNAHGSAMSSQQNNLTALQQMPLSSGTGVLNSRQSMLDASQSVSSADPGQGHALNQIQQVAMSSLQQNPVSTPQQMNNNSIQSQSGISPLQPNAYPLQANSNVLQPQQIKQEQQMFSAQQVKQQYQQRQMQHQYMHRQQILQQQATQQPASQLHPQQMMQQLNQTNDTNDMKMRHPMNGKPGLIQQHPSSGQRPSFHQQPMKSGSPYSVTSQPIHQVVSPQIGHHPSPQIDQQYLLASHKAGTPLQSANSPFIAPSPSTSMAPSPAPVDSEKINPSMSSLLNAENVRNQTTVPATVPGQSLSIGTPGISASPLLAEFTSTDGTHGAQSTVVSGNSSVLEQPLQRLLKAVKSMPPRTLSASVNDISSVVSMVDRIAGSAPGNGSRAAVGEDLVAMTKCRIQARNFFTQDGPGGTKKMRRYTTAVPSNVVSSTGSVNDNPRHLNGNESDGESTGASSSIKRPRVEANHALEEELREINQRLIDTVVYISEDDVDPTAAAEGGGGMIVKCSYSAVALSHNLKAQYASAQMSPIQPLRLLIPKNYPNCSPILLDNFPVEVSKEYEDLSIKAKARFNISLRALEQPMSLGEIAKTWDKCARAVISEYAQKSGGGTFSSKYGTWENYLSSAS